MSQNKLVEFQKEISYQFKNTELLTEAITHKSFSVEENKKKSHNERFEFLGDSILNFIVAEELVLLFPQEQEGVLSKKRAALVNLNKLAEIAKKYKLEKYINFGPGEIKQGNHLNPRIQGSCIEAIIGAIYLDSDFTTVKGWVLKQFSKSDFAVEVSASFGTDYKSRLQELTQKHKLGTPVYNVVLTSGPSHKPLFLVALILNDKEMSRGDGASKKIAEQKAAELYLGELTKAYKE